MTSFNYVKCYGRYNQYWTKFILGSTLPGHVGQNRILHLYDKRGLERKAFYITFWRSATITVTPRKLLSYESSVVKKEGPRLPEVIQYYYYYLCVLLTLVGLYQGQFSRYSDGLQAKWPGFDSQHEQEILFLFHSVQTGSGVNSASY
jgi:hypothetical protein